MCHFVNSPTLVIEHVHFSGKTLLAKTLARVLDVPFSVSDATSFTQVRVILPRIFSDMNSFTGWMSVYLLSNLAAFTEFNIMSDVGDDVDVCIQRLVRTDYAPFKHSSTSKL